MIDLHTHTTASDGMYSPAELVNKAFNSGLSVLAISDHDTIDGLKEGAEEAEKLGITFIPGIEINIDWPTGEFHLLGLGLKEPSKELSSLIKVLQEDRVQRNNNIIEKMRSDGINITLEDIKKIAQGGSIGRPHFAEYLVQQKKVKNRQAAFDNYLGKGRPYYIKHSGVNIDEAINAINLSGGIPIIAHPLSLYVSWGKIRPVLEDLFKRGIEGLEAWHPGARVVECQRLEEMAKEIGFFITAASDFHGEKVRADRKLGHTAGNKKIDDRFWFDELLPALKKNS